MAPHLHAHVYHMDHTRASKPQTPDTSEDDHSQRKHSGDDMQHSHINSELSGSDGGDSSHSRWHTRTWRPSLWRASGLNS